VDRPASTQIILNTHDPLVIGSLRKEEVRLFQLDENGKTEVVEPEIDPRGLGVEGILTSELFGLPSTMDEITQSKLDQRNELLLKQQNHALSEQDQQILQNLYNELEELGFSNTFRDPLYQKMSWKARISLLWKFWMS
jgi:hypothetical protein